MDNRDAQDVASAGWTGLRTIEKTLPSRAYLDPAHHQHELERIWYRDWVYLCRADTLAGPLDYRVFDIGTQQVLLLRDEAGQLRAFHNTCRHRGAALCAESEGTLRTRRITCPYHAWTYNLQGRLVGIPTAGRPVPVKLDDYPLHIVEIRQWGGFVYVSLAVEPPPFRPFFDEDLDCLERWPLAELKVGATHLWTVKCNWKIFWDNYSECLHCPGVHPGLSRMVPIYSRGILAEQEDPNWQDYADRSDPTFKGGLREGAATWSLDGRSSGHEFPGLSAADRAAGYAYITILPAQYLAAHVDYVRSVRIRPLGPEATEVYAEWLFPEAALADPGFDLRNTVQFSIDFLDEDAAVCELNHRGLRSIRHQEGVLMPEEIHVHRFQNWVRARL
ncbi:MAG TPA: aromatic ring-hydroxylating dioxygenase subunit alpha [Stellaceae bacterium]|nr:aromatic ring-hydroxylating dioxygenase subunit alpha [Stellaceae bacterium]